jgi:hypothetical protein
VRAAVFGEAPEVRARSDVRATVVLVRAAENAIVGAKLGVLLGAVAERD